jgi:hypothetical protein
MAYAHRGWAVFPCHAPTQASACSSGDRACSSPAKHPRTQRGLHDASTRPDVIKRWWRRWPTANVGIRTGAVSHLVVLDIDPPHGGDDSLESLIGDEQPLPPTITVLTGSGGCHLYFTHPGGTVHNSSSTLGPGIDVRGDGGYVIAPPSLHIAGDPYRWTVSSRLAHLPDWLRLLIQPPERPQTEPPPTRPGRAASDGTIWARAALAAEVASVASAQEGQRNHTLNRAAFALGQLVAGGHLDQSNVVSSLEAAGLASGLGAKETQRTVASGLRGGQQHPRHPAVRPRPERADPAAQLSQTAGDIDLRTIDLPAAAPRLVRPERVLEPAVDLPGQP